MGTWKLDGSGSNDITILEGDSVKWTWTGTHNLRQSTGDNCDRMTGPNATLIADVSGFTYEFAEPGTYYYICGIGTHCQNGMRGSVTVEPKPVPNSTKTTVDPGTQSAGTAAFACGAAL